MTRVPEWPRSAWSAVCERGRDQVRVLAGMGVETTDGWICEAVWDGSYCDGAFIGRISCSAAASVFVVTRLYLSRRARRSTGCTRGMADRRSTSRLAARSPVVDQVGPSTSVSSITRRLVGASSAVSTTTRDDVPTTVGDVRLTYFHNLVWDGHVLGDLAKPGIQRDFGTFETYRDFLARSWNGCPRTLGPRSATNRLGSISTLSSGHDSPTVTALVRGAGCRETFGLSIRGRGGHDDSGEAIGEAPRSPVPPDRYDCMALAATCGGAVSGLHRVGSFLGPVQGRRGLVARKVVFTGYYGDKVWGTNPTQPGDEFRRRILQVATSANTGYGRLHPLSRRLYRSPPDDDIQPSPCPPSCTVWTRPRYNVRYVGASSRRTRAGDMFALRKQRLRSAPTPATS